MKKNGKKTATRPKLGPTHDDDVQVVIRGKGLPDTRRNRLMAENVVAQHRLEQIAEDIEAKAAEVVLAAMQFGRVDPENVDSGPSDEMVLKMGKEKAMEVFRQMVAGMLPTKDSPVGLRVAMNIHATAMRVRGEKKQPALNVQVAQLNIASDTFPILKVDK